MKLGDRVGFILHTEGVLLDRDSEGRCKIGDDIQYEEAIKELEKGNQIGLLMNGRLFSIVEEHNKEYIERRV